MSFRIPAFTVLEINLRSMHTASKTSVLRLPRNINVIFKRGTGRKLTNVTLKFILYLLVIKHGIMSAVPMINDGALCCYSYSLRLKL